MTILYFTIKSLTTSDYSRFLYIKPYMFYLILWLILDCIALLNAVLRSLSVIFMVIAACDGTNKVHYY